MEPQLGRRNCIFVLVGLGVAGALLFCRADGTLMLPWGPNVLAWTTLALGGFWALARRAGIAARGDGMWFAVPLLFFAASFFLREDGFLRLWNGVLMLVSAALLVTRCRGPWRVSAAGYTEYLRLCALAAWYMASGTFAALGWSGRAGKSLDRDEKGNPPPPRVIMPNSRLGAVGKAAPPQKPAEAAAIAAAEVDSWFLSPIDSLGPEPAPTPIPAPAAPVSDAPEAREGDAAAIRSAGSVARGAGLLTLGAALKGVLLSMLPLTVFGLLFASADPVFGHLWDKLFDWNFGALAGWLIWGTLLGMVGLGLLHTALQRPVAPDQADKSVGPDGTVAPRSVTALFQGGGDVAVALILIDLLFAAFVAVQLNFLFGGADVVRSVPGLHYAAYAKGGFFELAWVAGLALPILLFSHWVTRAAPHAARRRVRQCTGVLVGLLLVVVASAFKRMALYESALGLTEDRLLVSVFIGAITAVFVWFVATVWRGRPRRFAIGLLVAAMLTIGGLDVVNPVGLVVRVDAHRAGGLRGLDIIDLEWLGTDAVPALTENIARMPADKQQQVANYLFGHTVYEGDYADEAFAAVWKRGAQHDWRQWNASDAAAERAVKAHAAQLSILTAEAQMRTAEINACGCGDATARDGGGKSAAMTPVSVQAKQAGAAGVKSTRYSVVEVNPAASNTQLPGGKTGS